MTNRRPNGFDWGVPDIDQLTQQVNPGRLQLPAWATDQFGQGRPRVDQGFNRGTGQRPPTSAPPRRASPWEEDAPGQWGDPDIDGGMGRMIDRRPPDRGWWEDRMADIRGQSNTVNPTQDWGDDRWMDTYEPGDFVQVKADGNPNFGKAWDGDSWEDSDPNDPANAAMFAESAGWDPEYQQGIREAWGNNDETAFQRWRNLARANMQSKWATGPVGSNAPDQPVSIPRQPGKPKPKAPTAPVNPPTVQPDPFPRKQRPIY